MMTADSKQFNHLITIYDTYPSFHTSYLLGTIELTNLQLKRTALDSLKLPIKVERGLVQKLHLKIPWTNLGAATDAAMPCR